MLILSDIVLENELKLFKVF